MEQQLPFFSIIIPTYARSGQLGACLRSLAQLDYPRGRFEVIVVDDGSQAPPMGITAGFAGQMDVTLLTQPHAGPAAGRNTGAARARGEFLAFTDDDCAPAPDWLHAIAARLASAPDCAVGGRTLNALPDNPYSTASQVLIDYLYTYYDATPDRARFLTSNNLALPAGLFRAVGGFDVGFPQAAAEDREFCHRWLRQGRRLAYAPEALIYHAHALTLGAFWRQHFNYGRGAFRFHQLCARYDREHFTIESRQFYLNLLRQPFSHARGGRARLLASLIVISQIANAAGFFREGAACSAA
jgi:GT2 family glycosyltransferase